MKEDNELDLVRIFNFFVYISSLTLNTRIFVDTSEMIKRQKQTSGRWLKHGHRCSPTMCHGVCKSTQASPHCTPSPVWGRVLDCTVRTLSLQCTSRHVRSFLTFYPQQMASCSRKCLFKHESILYCNQDLVAQWGQFTVLPWCAMGH